MKQVSSLFEPRVSHENASRNILSTRKKLKYPSYASSLLCLRQTSPARRSLASKAAVLTRGFSWRCKWDKQVVRGFPATSETMDESILNESNVINEEIEILNKLQLKLKDCRSLEDKIKCLLATERGSCFVHQNKWFQNIIKNLSDKEKYILLLLTCINQEHVLISYNKCLDVDLDISKIKSLSESLLNLEKFYDSLGGLIGYQIKSLSLISNSIKSQSSMNNDITEEDDNGKVEYLMPPYLDLSKKANYENIKSYVRYGIENLPYMAEIYALGGSGDRLGLECPISGDPLPAAMLPYCGRAMLDSLIRDVQAREYLYFKLTGKQHITPIAIMTSDAKGNDRHIKDLLELRNWYGRGKESFFIFKQPLVPIIKISDGQWLVEQPTEVVMRPGGHGVIWKLMHDNGVFDWLKSKQRHAAIVRQISNPMASVDMTLFALSGYGIKHEKSMGFMSCERVVGASEGMNVLRHKITKNTKSSHNGSSGEEHEYVITNIEYTEFERLGVSDVAICSNSKTSCFPANTNVLYVGIDAISNVISNAVSTGSHDILPGLIFNTKKKVTYFDGDQGGRREVYAGRMECMMQNMADSLCDKLTKQITENDELSTFMLCDARRKVTSSAKRKLKAGAKSIKQTPEGSFKDLTCNAREILDNCNFLLPPERSEEEYLKHGPEFIFLFNPALGPLWSVISHKILKGQMALGSELILEISEILIEDLSLDGSLLVVAENPVGTLKGPSVEFGDMAGRARLTNVKIKNKGINWKCHDNIYWQHKVERVECCQVILRGQSEFLAQDVYIQGDEIFEVPEGFRMEVVGNGAGYKKCLYPLSSAKPSWKWKYELCENNSGEEEIIKLTFI